MRRIVICLVLVGLSLTAFAAEPGLHPSTRKDVLRAIDQGLRWLEKQQQDDGHWSLAQFPALTALPARCFYQRPGRDMTQPIPVADKGLHFILTSVREDGGIYQNVDRPKGGGLRNYNTAICMAAFVASEHPEHTETIQRARDFLVRNQFLGEGVYRGGWGYDEPLGRPYCDMTNTTWTIESIALTTFVMDIGSRPCVSASRTPPRPEQNEEKKYADPNWEAALDFLERCQNIASDDMPGKDPVLNDANRGGFLYEPNRGMAGSPRPGAYNTHGAVTYAGLLSYLYMDLKRDDPRVAAAVDWMRRNYTLDEHPGLGQQGLFYYYLRLAMALHTWGEEPFKLADGTEIDWREDLAVKLVSLQRIDPKTGLGWWKNDTGRWMENDAVLSTSYVLLALETLVKEPK